ncbi:MAG TPA: hypothetical protein EYO76_14035 [Flavobacteriaceae bacterium]|nr:hypothetical protein [Flavobacteriaceae bacterium]
MKKILNLAVFLITALTIAQTNLSKAPVDANIVVTVKGNNLLQLISKDELDTSFIGNTILKEISRKETTYNSLEDFGFNLNASSHYFYQTNDSINYHAFIIPLKNVASFENLLKSNHNEMITLENGVKTIKSNSNEIGIWDNDTFVLVFGELNNLYLENSTVAERYDLEYEDSSLQEEWAVDVEVEDVTKDLKNIPDPPSPLNTEELIIEATEEEDLDYVEETVIETYDNYDYYNKNYAIKKSIAKDWLNQKALQILKSTGNNSILKNKSFLESVDNTAEASLWIGDFEKLFNSYIGSSYYRELNGFNFGNLYADTGIYANLYLEEDKMMLKSTYTMSDEMAKSYKKITSRKLNKSFLDYVNEDNLIAYLSYAIDTEEALKEYPKIMKSVYGSMPNYGEEANLGIDLFSLLLDEEALGEVLNGDLLFLLSGISQQEVTYTTYEYNDDYEYEEVEKTKTETIPDFLVMASTDNPSYLLKLINYSKNKQLITYTNGYYQLQIPQSPIALFFAIKDDILFFGTNETEMTNIVRGTFKSKISSKHKKLLSKNTSSMFISAKQLASQLPIEETGIDRTGKLEWFLNNTEDAYFKTSKVKGNTVQSEIVIEVPKTEENALKYIFNIIEKMAK